MKKLIFLLLVLASTALGQTYRVTNFGGNMVSVAHPSVLPENMFTYSENLFIGEGTRYTRPGFSKAFANLVGNSGIDAMGILESCDSIWAITLCGSVWYYSAIGALNYGGSAGVGRQWSANWGAWRQLWVRTDGTITSNTSNSTPTGTGTHWMRDLYPGDSLFAANDSAFIGKVKLLVDDDDLKLTANASHTHTGTYFVRRAFKAGRRVDLQPAYGNLYTANGYDHLQEISCDDTYPAMRKIGIIDSLIVQYASGIFPDSAKVAPFQDENGWTSISDTNQYDHGPSKEWNLDSNLNNGSAAYWRYVKVVDSTKAWAENEWVGFVGDSITGASIYYFAFSDRGGQTAAPIQPNWQRFYLPIIANTANTLYLQAPMGDSVFLQKYVDSSDTNYSPYPMETYYVPHFPFNGGNTSYPQERGYIVAAAGGGETVYRSKGTIKISSRANGSMWRFDTTGLGGGFYTGMWDRGIYYLVDETPVRSSGLFSSGKCNYCRPRIYNPWHFIRTCAIVGDSMKIVTSNFPDTTYNTDTTSFWKIVRFDVPHFEGLELYQEELVGWGDSNAVGDLMHTRTTVRGPEPDYWTTEGSFTASRTGEPVTAALAFDDRLFYWTDNTVNAILGDFSTGTIEEIAIDIGTRSPFSVVAKNKFVYFMHDDDYYKIMRRDLEGYTLQPLSAPVRNVFNDLYGQRRNPGMVRHPMNNAYRGDASAAYDEGQHRIWVFYPDSSNSYNNTSITLDVQKDTWDGYQDVGASLAFSMTYKDTLRLFMGSANNGMWTYTDGSFEDSGYAFRTKIGGVIVTPNADTVTSRPLAFWIRHAPDVTGDTGSPILPVYGTVRMYLNGDDGSVVDTMQAYCTYAALGDRSWTSVLSHGRTQKAGDARIWKWDLEWIPIQGEASSMWEPIWMEIDFQEGKAGQ